MRETACHAVRSLQARLQRIYALDVPYDAALFVVDDHQRALLAEAMGGAPSTDREALWVLEDTDELEVALCLSDDLMGATALDESLDRYCALLEGVSHLTYLLDRARHRRELTLLEMELQAEVDKILTTWFARTNAKIRAEPGSLLRRLFVECRLEPRSCPDEADRYRAANRLAHRYCHYLRDRFLEPARIEDLLAEIRRFWRMGLAEKLRHISGAYTGTRSAA